MIDHLRNTQSVGLEDLAVLILDEADRLLEMGFAEEVRAACAGSVASCSAAPAGHVVAPCCCAVPIEVCSHIEARTLVEPWQCWQMQTSSASPTLSPMSADQRGGEDGARAPPDHALLRHHD